MKSIHRKAEKENLSKRRSNRLKNSAQTFPGFYSPLEKLYSRNETPKPKATSPASKFLFANDKSRDSDGFMVPLPILKKKRDSLLSDADIVGNDEDFAQQLQNKMTHTDAFEDPFSLFNPNGKLHSGNLKRSKGKQKNGESAFLRRNKRIYGGEASAEEEGESDKEFGDDETYEDTDLGRALKPIVGRSRGKGIKPIQMFKKSLNSFFLDKHYFEMDESTADGVDNRNFVSSKPLQDKAAKAKMTHSKVFELIQKNQLDLNHFTSSWTNFYFGNKTQQSHAIRLLVNLIFESAGMGKNFFPLKVFQNVNSKAVEIYENNIEFDNEKELFGYPFLGKGTYKQFGEKLCVFFKEFVMTLSRDSLFHKRVCFDVIEKWLFNLSFVRMRRLRYCASCLGFYIIEGILGIFANVNESEIKYRRQLNLEIQKLSKDEALKNPVVLELMEQIKQMRSRMAAIKEFFNNQYTLMFTNKMRDTSLEIRVELLHALRRWMKLVPSWVLESAYSKYIGWTLCDKEADVRVASLSVLKDIINLLLDGTCDELTVECCTQFVKFCKNRILQMRYDVSLGVRKEAIATIYEMANHSLLSREEIQTILDVFWRSSDAHIAQLYAEIINSHILETSIFRKEEFHFDEEGDKSGLGNKRQRVSQIMNAPYEEVGLQQKELRSLLTFVDENIPHITHVSTSSDVKLYRLTEKVVNGFWDKAPCIRNIRMLLEALSVGETGALPLQQLPNPFRTPLLYLFQRSFSMLIEKSYETEKSKTAKTLESFSAMSLLHSSIQYILEHSHTLLSLHRSDPEHLNVIIAILTAALMEYHRFAINFNLLPLVNELIRLTREHDSAMVYKSALRCLAAIVECVKGEDMLYESIKELNGLFSLDVQSVWNSYEIEFLNPLETSKNLDIPAAEKNHQTTPELLKCEEYIGSAIQKYVHFHCVMPNEWEVDVKVIEICALAIRNRISTFHHANTLNPETSSTKDESTLTHSSAVLPSVRIVLNSCDLMLVTFEKLVYELLSLRSQIKADNDTCTDATTNTGVNGNADNDCLISKDIHAVSSLEKNQIDLAAKLNALTELLLKAQDLFQRMRNLFIGLLEVEENIICNFGVFLTVMTIAQLTTALFSEDELDSFGKAKDFSFTDVDYQSLFNTLNGFLRCIEASKNAVDDEYVWVHSDTHLPLFPLYSCSPVLDMAKDSNREELFDDEAQRSAQKLHIAITACQFVVNSNNMSLWQSSLGTLILIQLNANQPRITAQANMFMQLLKKRDMDKFFRILLKSFIILHSAYLSKDISRQEVMGLCTAIAQRLGISLSLKIKISLCKFVYDALAYSITEAGYEGILEYIYPIAARRFLTKQEVGFLEKQLQKEMEFHHLEYSKSAAEKLIFVFLKKPIEATPECTEAPIQSSEIKGNEAEIHLESNFSNFVEAPKPAISVSSLPSLRISSVSSVSDTDAAMLKMDSNLEIALNKSDADMDIDSIGKNMDEEFDAFPLVNTSKKTVGREDRGDILAEDISVEGDSSDKDNSVSFDAGKSSHVVAPFYEDTEEPKPHSSASLQLDDEEESQSRSAKRNKLLQKASPAISELTAFTFENNDSSVDFEFKDENLFSSLNFDLTEPFSVGKLTSKSSDSFDWGDGLVDIGTHHSENLSKDALNFTDESVLKKKVSKASEQWVDKEPLNFDDDALSDVTSFADDLLQF